MKVLIIPSWYPTSHFPYSGIFIKEQAESLQNIGLDISVAYPEIISLRHFNGIIKNKNDFIPEEGILINRYKSYNYLFRIKRYHRILYQRSLRKAFKKYLEKFGKPDIIHAHSILWGGWAAAQLCEEFKIPLVVTEHSSAFGKKKIEQYQIPLIKNTLNRANKVISVSPVLKLELEKYAKKNNIVVIPNGVDSSSFISKSHVKKNNKKFRFFSLATLTHGKGMDILIKSFSKAFREIENVQLVIGGDGDERRNLEYLAAQEGVSEKIQFLGKLSRSQVVEEMQNCNSFVLASRYETFGVVFIEALACGKPIIATRCGGPEMIVNRQNGLLSNVNDIKALKDNLLYIYNNINYYNSKLIINDCVNRFSDKAVGQKIINLYKEITKV